MGVSFGVVVAVISALEIRKAKERCEGLGGGVCPQCKTRNDITYTSL